ncbi:fumarylacetoacetate hydrolase family protein [Modestobacter lapidis]|nr:fumarylacetoacetate hydrolase family protein [Modestobacter lapidis]
MRYIAFQDGAVVTVGLVRGDEVIPVAEVSDFYADLPRWTSEEPASARPAQARSSLEPRPPVPGTAKVVCVGLNYRDHADEANAVVPDHPTVFGRWPSTLISDGDTIPVPPSEPGLDWEVELAVVVGRTLTDADEETAAAAVFGYTVFNDITGRSRQFDTTQWMLGKNLDRSGPIGPVIVTAEELGEPGGLKLETRVNGEVMQVGSTSDMLFSVGRILSYISQTTTLQPGDVVATGTPAGVGFVRTPPRLLVSGDVVEVEIEQIGTLRNTVVDAAARP